MSFVTTASRSWSPSVRQSAATRAVLPEPTGPPMPTRSARTPVTSGSCGSTPGSGWVCGTSSGPCECSSGCKETHLPGGVELGADVEQRGALGRQRVDRVAGPGRGVRRGPVDLGGQRGDQGMYPVGVQPEQPDRRTGRPG